MKLSEAIKVGTAHSEYVWGDKRLAIEKLLRTIQEIKNVIDSETQEDPVDSLAKIFKILDDEVI